MAEQRAMRGYAISKWLTVHSTKVHVLGRAPAAEFRLKSNKLRPGCEGPREIFQAAELWQGGTKTFLSTGVT